MDYDTPDDEPLKPQYVVEQFSRGRRTTPSSDRRRSAPDVGRPVLDVHRAAAVGFVPRSRHDGLRPARRNRRRLAAPDEEVVCVDGDGSFLMTCRACRSPSVSNSISPRRPEQRDVGMVRQWQDAFFEGRRMAAGYDWVPSSTSSPRRSARAAGPSTPTRRSTSRYRKHALRRAERHRRSHRPRGERLRRWSQAAVTTASSRSTKTIWT